MTRFTASKQSAATVRSSPKEVWAALTDPELLPRLTPYLQRIDAEGDTWTWRVTRARNRAGGVAGATPSSV